MNYYENEWFEIIYNESDPYKDLIIDTVNTRTRKIAQFFGITKLDKKRKVVIYYSINDFKNYLVPLLADGKYYDWMMGSTHDGNINMLSLDCCHQTKSHRDMSVKDYIDGIVHEIVHIFHHELKGNNKTRYGWFHEALSTNLSNQEYNIVPISCTLEELTNNFNEVKHQYDISYTLGRCILENYSHDFILSICKDETILDKIADKLFDEVREYVESNYKRR